VITELHQDRAGSWVAELSCLHRERVPGRRDQLVDCPRCDRAELPEGLHVVRTSATWTEATLPAALQRHHRLAAGVWALLRVEQGSVRFVARTRPQIDVVVAAGGEQPIPPEVDHHLVLLGPMAVHLEFLRGGGAGAAAPPDET
jgi:tellurite resistance-related uncharacterized protein